MTHNIPVFSISLQHNLLHVPYSLLPNIMYIFENKIRVRYAETDRMGYVYYGNYAAYFETGRIEALRALGLSYKVMEQEGIMLPVLSYQVKYFKPAFFDDILTIRTIVNTIPTGTRITFHYESINEQNVCINKAETSHVFVKTSNGRPCAVPVYILEKLAPFFQVS
jgi:acyl-CoA thioester hydrolase